MDARAWFLSVALVASGCGGGSECTGAGGVADPCEFDGEPTFSGNVVPLLNVTCAVSSACHTERVRRAGQSLGPSCDAATRLEVHDGIVGVPSETEPALDRIEAGDPDASFLIHKVEGDFAGLDCDETDDCGVQMPKADDPLSGECIAMLRAWITAGAPSD